MYSFQNIKEQWNNFEIRKYTKLSRNRELFYCAWVSLKVKGPIKSLQYAQFEENNENNVQWIVKYPFIRLKWAHARQTNNPPLQANNVLINKVITLGKQIVENKRGSLSCSVLFYLNSCKMIVVYVVWKILHTAF